MLSTWHGGIYGGVCYTTNGARHIPPSESFFPYRLLTRERPGNKVSPAETSASISLDAGDTLGKRPVAITHRRAAMTASPAEKGFAERLCSVSSYGTTSGIHLDIKELKGRRARALANSIGARRSGNGSQV